MRLFLMIIEKLVVYVLVVDMIIWQSFIQIRKCQG